MQTLHSRTVGFLKKGKQLIIFMDKFNDDY